MTIEHIVDAYLQAYCTPEQNKRADLVRSVWNANGRLSDPPMEAVGFDAIEKQAAMLLQQFPSHTFRRESEVDTHHEFAAYDWSLRSADGAKVLEGRDFMTLDVDGRIMTVVGFFGSSRPRTS